MHGPRLLKQRVTTTLPFMPTFDIIGLISNESQGAIVANVSLRGLDDNIREILKMQEMQP